MKTFLLVLSAVAALLLPTTASACDCCNHHHDSHASTPAPAAASPLAAGEARVTIPVAGMHCGHCASRVEAVLTKMTGVKLADASYDNGEVVVVYESAKVRPAKLIEAIDGLGFKAGSPATN